MNLESRSCGGFARERGFSLLELLFVVAVTGVIAAIAMPMMAKSIDYFRLSGDARSVSNATALAKMRAAATFSRGRLYVDLTGKTFRVESWQKTGTPGWAAVEGTTNRNSNDTFGFGVVGSAPPNTQATIGQAPACLDSTGTVIANTACVVFNSRGVPVDATGAPTPIDAIYLTDGTAVYGITVSATGMIRMWRTTATATPAWTLQ